MTRPHSAPLRIAIIGAGPGGLCMGIRLQEAGFEDFVILEKARGLGGTWYHNRYPGCECDIPSHLYSFSFFPKADWSKPYGTQPEILAYLEDLADAHDLRRRCRFGDGVASARWSDARAEWMLVLESGAEVVADVVVSALGMFNELAYPAIEGLDGFADACWHSARWNADHDLTGERVGVIGSAASAVQLVPEIAKAAGRVHLFQRTANWVVPKQDEPFTPEQLAAFGQQPELLKQIRDEVYEGVDRDLTFSNAEARAEMEGHCLAAMEQVKDPEVRAKLRPQHPFGCKRPLLSNDFYPAFNRPNLELVTEPIERITPHGIVTTDGRERTIDTLILATGFAATRYLAAIDVQGRGGRSIHDAWKDGAEAYLGVCTTGFPNLFMLYGPNTNNGSLLTMIEAEVDFTLRQIQRLQREGLAWMDARPDAQARYNEQVQAAMDRVEVWNIGCSGYYRSPSGRIVTQWPGSMTAFRDQLADDHRDAFETGAR